MVETKIKRVAKAHQRYTLEDGTAVPGVTTVLSVINKPALVKWANNLGLQGIDSTAYTKETAVIGTLGHEMIQEYLGGPEWDRSRYTPAQVDLAENALLSFLEWERQTGHKMKTTFIEKSLVSEGDEYGGTIDWYGEIDGKMWLVDIKTSNALYPEHIYQIAAYWTLLLHNGYPCEGVRLLRAGRTEDEGFDDHVLDMPTLFNAFDVFFCALKLYRQIQAFEKNQKGENKNGNKRNRKNKQ